MTTRCSSTRSCLLQCQLWRLRSQSSMRRGVDRLHHRILEHLHRPPLVSIHRKVLALWGTFTRKHRWEQCQEIAGSQSAHSGIRMPGYGASPAMGPPGYPPQAKRAWLVRVQTGAGVQTRAVSPGGVRRGDPINNAWLVEHNLGTIAIDNIIYRILLDSFMRSAVPFPGHPIQ